MKRMVIGIVAACVLAFLVVQFIRPSIPQEGATAEIHVPANVKAVLVRDCYSCHSNERRLAWYDEVEPAYWLVRKDIVEARAGLNFSTLGSKPEAAQKGALYESVAMMQLGTMPLPRYVQLHPEAKVTAEDIKTIKEYLSPWSSPIPLAATEDAGVGTPVAAGHDSVKPSLNGIPYEDWRGWRLIAVTDRGDNHQFRMILGNDVAVKAAREGNVHPWPDGTRFAKLAWWQQQRPDGLVVPGAFFQVEMMIKDAQRFRDTDGWGWARWRGVDLKPYGNSAAFVRECTGCHLPMRGNDYVYTEPFSAARVAGDEVVNNAAMRLPKGLAFNPLDWAPVTMYSDPQRHTISVVFADTKDGMTPGAGGAEEAVVTWTGRDDPHWFGARVADKVVSVETATAGGRPGFVASWQPARVP
jgi:hypothetical protein